MKVLIITPLYKRPGSGASTYYSLLTSLLKNKQINVVVISEYDKSIKSNYYGLFPLRASQKNNKFLNYILYFFQNIAFLIIPIILKKEKPDLVLIHSSFFNNYNSLILILRLMKLVNFKYSNNIVIDFRDSYCSPKTIDKISTFSNSFIACSENVYKHINASKNKSIRKTKIPIPHEFIKAPFDDVVYFCESKKLPLHQYIAYAGLIKQTKNVDLLIDVYEKLLHKKNFKIPKLVLAGIIKDKSLFNKKIKNNMNIKYIGNLSKRDVGLFFSGSCLAVNLSTVEGMPRSSLEAMEQRVPVILPPNVPEFSEKCSKITWSGNINEIEDIFDRQLSNPVPHNYDLDLHNPEKVVESYIEEFKSVINSNY